MKDHKGSTPLHAASANGRAAVVQALLEHGAEVDVRDAMDETPLLHAARKGRGQVVRLLVEAGADVNARTRRGMTAMKIAESVGNHGVAAALLRGPVRTAMVSGDFLTEAHLELSAGRPPPVVHGVEYDENNFRGWRFTLQVGNELSRGTWRDTMEEAIKDRDAVQKALDRGTSDDKILSVIDRLHQVIREPIPEMSAPLNLRPRKRKSE
jgi:hypothetical protein